MGGVLSSVFGAEQPPPPRQQPQQTTIYNSPGYGRSAQYQPSTTTNRPAPTPAPTNRRSDQYQFNTTSNRSAPVPTPAAPKNIFSPENQALLDTRRHFELTNNEFSPFYTNAKDSRSNPHGPKYGKQKENDAISNYRHSMAIEFAATSWLWESTLNVGLHFLPRLSPTSLLKTYAPEPNVTMAFYRVVADKTNKYILIACHVNVHGFHRGDLRFIEVNDRTVVKGSESNSVVDRLFLGDVLAVTELARMSNGPAVGSDVSSVCQESQCTWMVRNATLIERNIRENVSFSFLENGTAVVSGFDEVMNVPSRFIRRQNLVFTGNAFLPRKMELAYTKEFPGKHWVALKLQASKMSTYPTAVGTIFTMNMSEENTRRMNVGFDAFGTNLEDDEKGEVVETCALMGYSGAVAVLNGRFDCRCFEMHEIQKDRLVVRFLIDNPLSDPTIGRWNIGTRIEIAIPNGDINAVIETVLPDANSRRLRIAARISRDSPRNLEFDKNRSYIVSQREPMENEVLLEGFFKFMNPSTNGRRIIETLYGGEPLELIKTGGTAKFQYPAEPPVHLNENQNEYVSAILAHNPMVIGSSPFGCGKSMTLVTAALEVFKQNCSRKGHFQQLLLTQSNYASVNLVDIVVKVNNSYAKFVRYLSEKNWNELPDTCRTDYDLPKMMLDVFQKHADGDISDKQSAKKLEKRHKNAIETFLNSNKTKQKENSDGKEQKIRVNSYSWSVVVESFFILYQPDIIVATADSLQGLVKCNVLNDISTIQIDEASQVPEYTIIYLLKEFSNACFGLIGDIKQLPPYCEDELTGKIREFGVGRLMERALEGKLFPHVLLRSVYRCHPVATRLLSDLFYDGMLLPGVSEDQRNSFITRRTDIWPNARSPFIVVNNRHNGYRMGTSCGNHVEKDLVVQLVASLTKPHNGYQLQASDIGVISFYAAQTNILTEALRGSGVKCGTVDAFQGSEREVVVLCCTNERLSEFMQLPNRLNVALSRARQATIIIGNLDGLRRARFWNTIVQRAQNNKCLVETDREPFIVRNPPNNPNFGNRKSFRR